MIAPAQRHAAWETRVRQFVSLGQLAQAWVWAISQLVSRPPTMIPGRTGARRAHTRPTEPAQCEFKARPEMAGERPINQVSGCVFTLRLLAPLADRICIMIN